MPAGPVFDSLSYPRRVRPGPGADPCTEGRGFPKIRPAIFPEKPYPFDPSADQRRPLFRGQQSPFALGQIVQFQRADPYTDQIDDLEIDWTERHLMSLISTHEEIQRLHLHRHLRHTLHETH